MGRPKIRKDYAPTAWLETLPLGDAVRDELTQIADVEYSPEQSARLLSEVEVALGEYWAHERVLDQRPRDTSAAKELLQLEPPVSRLIAALTGTAMDSLNTSLDLAGDLDGDISQLTEPASSALKRQAYARSPHCPHPHEVVQTLRLFVDSGGGMENSRVDLTALLKRFVASIAEATAQLRGTESRGRSRRDAYAYLVATLSRVYRKYGPTIEDSTASLEFSRDPIRHDGASSDPPLHGGRLEIDFVVAALDGGGIPHSQDREAIARLIRG